MTLSVSPISPSRDRNSEEGNYSARSSPIDSKVRGVVLDLICSAKGGLFASASAPQVVIDVLSVVESAKFEYRLKEKRKSKLRKAPLIRRAPIGLRPCDEEGWLNALMQFILSIPDIVELFFFAPKSFYPFQEFIDQYHLDQQEGKALSQANGVSLYRFISASLTNFSLHEIFEFILDALHKKCQIHPTVEAALKEKGESDLFVAERCLKRQFFTEKELFCYDLNGFIELRPDGPRVYFITYLKVHGIWYQCDDDQITELRSSSLNIPLNRAILLHYKRVDFRKY
jgi:hypothetical protein